ncbi:hypothetical protein Taro_025273 [Colocasia esculenta]|uniref:Leucine-rich repeat-containing N-terminal plant-type domain-containing protein n=1 Tax=Colocasia esculenta TaxID=4460 RepID=A0A843V2U3_COLES|nr:hypothetical protein [Colocasia esculenta]
MTFAQYGVIAWHVYTSDDSRRAFSDSFQMVGSKQEIPVPPPPSSVAPPILARALCSSAEIPISSTGRAPRVPEYQALLSLKASLVDFSGVLASWDGATDHCGWAGVVCNPLRRDAVVSVDLCNLNLSNVLLSESATSAPSSTSPLPPMPSSAPYPSICLAFPTSATSTSPTMSSMAASPRRSLAYATSRCSISTTTTSPVSFPSRSPRCPNSATSTRFATREVSVAV